MSGGCPGRGEAGDQNAAVIHSVFEDESTKSHALTNIFIDPVGTFMIGDTVGAFRPYGPEERRGYL
jgi:hypothetical protein